VVDVPSPGKRVLGIDINTCAGCGGKLKVIASIEEAQVIGKILAHLQKRVPDQQQAERPLGARAPPLGTSHRLLIAVVDFIGTHANSVALDRRKNAARQRRLHAQLETPSAGCAWR
jgi:hypothetical protein